MYKCIRKVWNSIQQKLTLRVKFIDLFSLLFVVQDTFKQNLDDHLPRTGVWGEVDFYVLTSPRFYSSPRRIL